MLNGDEQLQTPATPEFAEVGEKKKTVVKPRVYMVDGPDGVKLIKATTPAQVSAHFLKTLGYDIEVPDKDTLVDLLSDGVIVEDISKTAAQAAA